MLDHFLVCIPKAAAVQTVQLTEGFKVVSAGGLKSQLAALRLECDMLESCEVYITSD